MAVPLENRSDCTRCAALCCIAYPSQDMPGFAAAKDAGIDLWKLPFVLDESEARKTHRPLSSSTAPSPPSPRRAEPTRLEPNDE